MTPAQAQLLRDVAAAIIESGYAVRVRRPNEQRRWQIEALSSDARLDAPQHSEANLALIADVIAGCNVTRQAARHLMSQARKIRRAQNR